MFTPSVEKSLNRRDSSSRRRPLVSHPTPDAGMKGIRRFGPDGSATDPVEEVREMRGCSWLSHRLAPLYRLDPCQRAADALVIVAICAGVGLLRPVLTATVMILGLTVLPRLYKHRLTLSALDQIPSAIAAGASLAFIAAVLTQQGWTRTGLAWFCLLVSAGLVLSRAIVAPLQRRHRRRNPQTLKRTIIVGAGRAAVDLAETLLAEPEFGLNPVALVDCTSTEHADRLGLPLHRFGPGGLPKLIGAYDATTVIVAFSDYDDRDMLGQLRDCVRLDTELFILPRLFDYVSLEGSMDRVKALPLIRVRRAAHRSLMWLLKRPVDVLLSGSALLVLSPLLAVLAVLVKLDDRQAPVLFRQERIGLDGQPFELLKFRSMRPETSVEANTTWNIAGDPRISRLGAFMRKFSLDELPQIYNVFRGDMALVGPRPERPHFVEKFSGEVGGYRSRHRVPVGLTGWAAINGYRGDTSIKDRVMFDNFYIENWSPWLDFKCLVLTIGAVLRGSGS